MASKFNIPGGLKPTHCHIVSLVLGGVKLEAEGCHRLCESVGLVRNVLSGILPWDVHLCRYLATALELPYLRVARVGA